MKKIIAMFAVVSMLASCSEKKVEPAAAPEPPKQEVYQPQHQSTTVDLKTAKKYAYYNAPTSEPATSVVVNYDAKKLYAPITVVYSYAKGDSFTYTIPDFGLWKNSAGRFRVISDADGTVWLQGQTKSGKFHELVFFGNPKYNGMKIKPNSYSGKINYRK